MERIVFIGWNIILQKKLVNQTGRGYSFIFDKKSKHLYLFSYISVFSNGQTTTTNIRISIPVTAHLLLAIRF